MLVNMPVTSRSYTGVANFNYAGDNAIANTLTIPFTTAYSRDPVCTFTQEGGTILLSKIESFNDRVVIHLYDAYVSGREGGGGREGGIAIICIMHIS